MRNSQGEVSGGDQSHHTPRAAELSPQHTQRGAPVKLPAGQDGAASLA